MKYCSKCGKENKDDARFCEACGHPFEVNNFNNFNNNSNMNYQKPVSTLGNVSMILGIIALASLVVCCFLPVVALIAGPVAIILGIVFLVKHKDLPNKQAVMGIVFGSIAFVIGLTILITLLTTDLSALQQIALDECTNNPNGDTCKMYQQLFPDWFK